MMRWSCQRLQGCVPVDASARSCDCASSCSCILRSTMRAAASAKDSQRPVRTSISDAISSPTRSWASAVPCAAACKSSKRFVRSSVSRLRIANSSSTATVKSRPFSYASNAERTCSSGLSFCASPIARLRYCGKQPVCYAGPAPAFDDGTPGRLAELRPLVVGQREQRCQLVAQLGDVSVRKADERGALGWVLRVDPFGPPGEPRMARDERRHARRGGLGRDHPEGLREDRRHDCDVAQRQELDEMPVLERAREERSRRRQRLELFSIVPEADDDGLHVEALQRLQQQVDSLVEDQLP